MYNKNIKITDDAYDFGKYSQEEMRVLSEIGEDVSIGRGDLNKIKSKIKKYPNLPGLYNYLSIVYVDSNNSEKAFETTLEIVEKFPDYLFGKINLANFYIEKKQLEKVAEIFESFDITELYPKREVFHEGEIFNFEYMKILYFLEKNEIENATVSLEYLKLVNSDHPILNNIEKRIFDKTRDKTSDYKIDEPKNRVLGEDYNKKIQTEDKPDFKHKEILELYSYDVEIDVQLLNTIKNLPRKTLVEDLEKIIVDAQLRYEYFSTGKFRSEELYFVFHAFFILAEIQSKESLPKVLDFLSFNQEFIDFWIGEDFLTEDFWKIIYQLSDEENYELLFNFLILPNVGTYSKTSVLNTLINVIHNNPKFRDDIVKSLKLTIEYFLKNEDNKELFDDLFLTFLVGDLVVAHLYELLPEIVDLYNKGIVVEGIVGTLNEAEEVITSDDEIEKDELFLNIFDEYEEMTESWWDDDDEWDDDLNPKLIVFLNSLSQEKREEFLVLYNDSSSEDEFFKNFELLSEFIDNLEYKQRELFMNYALSMQEEGEDEEIDLEFIEFYDTLDEEQKNLYMEMAGVEDDNEIEKMAKKFRATLNEKQEKLFMDYMSISEDEEVLDPKLVKFLNSIDENTQEEFFSLSDNKSDDEEENIRQVDKFVNTLNKKQKRLFVDYAASIPEEEIHKPVIIKNELKVGRNDPCPCGSGKKYKKCCMKK